MPDVRHTTPSESADAIGADYDRLAELASGAPERFDRRFWTRIHTVDGGWISLTDMDDDFHSMRIALRVTTEGEIVEAAGRMLRHPYDVCPRATESLHSLVGMNVFGGVKGKIAERIPRSEGCVHFADMLGIAFRSFKIARGHDMPWPKEQEGMRKQILELVPTVRDTCVSFAVRAE